MASSTWLVCSLFEEDDEEVTILLKKMHAIRMNKIIIHSEPGKSGGGGGPGVHFINRRIGRILKKKVNFFISILSSFFVFFNIRAEY